MLAKQTLDRLKALQWLDRVQDWTWDRVRKNRGASNQPIQPDFLLSRQCMTLPGSYTHPGTLFGSKKIIALVTDIFFLSVPGLALPVNNGN